MEYPYGKGGTFVHNEVAFLAAAFHKVYIIPEQIPESSEVSLLPNNVEILHLNITESRTRRNWIIFSNMPLLFELIFQEIFFSRQKKGIWENRKKIFFMLISLLYKKKALKTILQKEDSSVFYSYWFSNYATLLGILKRNGIIPSFISRAHGFDLYEDNGKYNYIPFRYFQLKQVKKIYCVSEKGANYLKGIYPQFKEKIFCNHLGVSDYGSNPFSKECTLTIVTCSNIIPVKRVHLMVEILSLVKKDVKWIHFGEGYLKQEMMEKVKALPINIVAEFRGYVSIERLMEFYKSNPVSLFINTSISEGLPVSIQEAISFGIPIMATDAGGTSEIVNDKTGILLPLYFDVKEAAKQIDDFSSSFRNTEEFRWGVKAFWNQYYNAQNNYPKFVQQLL
ncbi:MAG: glycosyltransferase, partial [Bacteroidia bacterium]